MIRLSFRVPYRQAIDHLAATTTDRESIQRARSGNMCRDTRSRVYRRCSDVENANLWISFSAPCLVAWRGGDLGTARRCSGNRHDRSLVRGDPLGAGASRVRRATVSSTNMPIHTRQRSKGGQTGLHDVGVDAHGGAAFCIWLAKRRHASYDPRLAGPLDRASRRRRPARRRRQVVSTLASDKP
jgi:hypothetical protein